MNAIQNFHFTFSPDYTEAEIEELDTLIMAEAAAQPKDAPIDMQIGAEVQAERDDYYAIDQEEDPMIDLVAEQLEEMSNGGTY